MRAVYAFYVRGRMVASVLATDEATARQQAADQVDVMRPETAAERRATIAAAVVTVIRMQRAQ